MESEKAIRGLDVNSVCSFDKGVYGGVEEGESITQLPRCERMRLDGDISGETCRRKGRRETYLMDILGSR